MDNATQESRFGSAVFLGPSAGCYKWARVEISAPYHEWVAVAQQIEAHDAMLAALKHAEKLAWEVGCESDDGVNTILEDSRGDLWREITAAIAKAEGK